MRLLDVMCLGSWIQVDVTFLIQKHAKLFIIQSFEQSGMFCEALKKLVLLIKCQLDLLCCKFALVCFFVVGGCIIMDKVGAGLCCGVRLVCEYFSNQLVIFEAVARVHWHFLALPSDQRFIKIDVHPNLPKEDSSNDEVTSKGTLADDALHSFAFVSQGKFREHDIVETDVFGACKRTIFSIHDDWGFEIKQLRTFGNDFHGCHVIRRA